MIEYVTEDEGIPELFEILVKFHGEFGIAPLDIENTLRVVRDVVHNHCAIVARVEGQLVGTFGIIETALWYSARSTVLVDKWLYVVPEHRGKVAVLRALLHAGASFAEEVHLPLYVYPNHSPRREPRTEIERVGVTLRFDPMGSILAVR
jgi:GNAT superfamily N-acetyltransferase